MLVAILIDLTLADGAVILGFVTWHQFDFIQFVLWHHFLAHENHMLHTIYVTPRFSSDSFLERGLPVLKFFRRLPVTKRGIPVSKRGPHFGMVPNRGFFPRIPNLARILFQNG